MTCEERLVCSICDEDLLVGIDGVVDGEELAVQLGDSLH